MKNVVLLGGISAFVTGMAIGYQSLLSGKAANIAGSLKTGLWVNFIGGILAGLIILAVTFFIGRDVKEITRSFFLIVFVAGALGIFIIMGISFSISKAGVTAGLAATMLGQFAFGLVADSLGWSGDPIPLDYRRIVGIAVMVVATVLILPKD
jgi:uncharacterized membrane protein YdcZ (DUF606 family)